MTLETLEDLRQQMTPKRYMALLEEQSVDDGNALATPGAFMQRINSVVTELKATF